jgi:ubiquinone/menaquinone biosynthesis C-methylase UbiE
MRDDGAVTTAPRPTRFALGYARLAPVMDGRGAAQHRAELVAGLAGSVVEVGCGPGSMFAHYPAAVTSVLAVEPDPYLRDRAVRAAAGAAVPVTVVAGRADALPVRSGSVDAVVFSLVLCSVPDVSVALSEARRVLRPGGELRFYEHVRSASRVVGWLETAVTPLWSRMAGGCHPNRDTVAAIGGAGFDVGVVRRFAFSVAPLAPPVAHVLGRARVARDGGGE